jgi:hypothetical protein
MTETVSVTAKITPVNSAGIQANPSPNFNSTAVTPEEITTPGPAKRATGLKVGSPQKERIR